MSAPRGRAGIPVRRTRLPCPHCDERVELSRMRAHLREMHQVGSSDLEGDLLAARRAGRRASRGTSR